MSRLDSFIRRLETQRDCLDAAVGLLAGLPGPVLEVGLGNGRTYHHLLQRCPEREIFVFDRHIAAHPSWVPDAAHTLLGDFADTLPGARPRIGAPAALANVDVGSGDAAASRALGERLAGWLAPLMASGAVVVSDQPMTTAPWRALALPDGAPEGRYFMYQVEG